MTSHNATLVYQHRIERLVRAGLLTDLREPVGVSLFQELPPLDRIRTKDVHRGKRRAKVHRLTTRTA